jgi:putative Mn2+ efflux pump MntP
MWDIGFFINSILLGVGLAMDAFSVSLANGLNEPLMKKRKMFLVAGTFGFFQALMPMIGWFLVHSLVTVFSVLEKFVPYTALALLGFIGGKMIYDGIKNKGDSEGCALCFSGLIVQGIATSIDALSVGLTIAEYGFMNAFVSALIIMAITFGLCVLGVFIGKKFGTKLSGKATLIGGVILILIGIEIFVSSFIG